MQAVQRGRKSRKTQRERKVAMAADTEEVVVPEAADASEQVDSVAAQREEAAVDAAAKAVMDEDAAATKMQAIQRGKNSRTSSRKASRE